MSEQIERLIIVADDLTGALVLSGGVTAEAVLDAMDVEILTVEEEILPGLPLSAANGWRIVTKSGGFGAPSTLNDLTRGVE